MAPAPRELAARGCPGSRYLLLGILLSKLLGEGGATGWCWVRKTPPPKGGDTASKLGPEEWNSGQKEAGGAVHGGAGRACLSAYTAGEAPSPQRVRRLGDSERAPGYLPSLLPEKQGFPRCPPAFGEGRTARVTVKAGQTGTGFRERLGGPAASGAL